MHGITYWRSNWLCKAEIVEFRMIAWCFHCPLVKTESIFPAMTQHPPNKSHKSGACYSPSRIWRARLNLGTASANCPLQTPNCLQDQILVIKSDSHTFWLQLQVHKFPLQFHSHSSTWKTWRARGVSPSNLQSFPLSLSHESTNINQLVWLGPKATYKFL